MRAATSNGRARPAACTRRSYGVGFGQLWARANRAGYARCVATRSLSAVALAMAALAAVLLPLAIARRCSSGDEAAPPPPPPRPLPPRNDATVAAMYGAACRHALACGVGRADRCAFIEDTMRRMPADFAIRRCDRIDDAEARRCIAELGEHDCRGASRSLDLHALQAVLDRIAACRLACATVSSP